MASRGFFSTRDGYTCVACKSLSEECAPMTCSAVIQKPARQIARKPTIAVWVLATASVLSLCGCGCGGDLPELGKVKGVVTLDGQPLAEAQVEFLPESGRPSGAETDEDGRYRLRYTADTDGAIVGRHTVKIRTAIDGRDDPASERLPPRYHSPSELTADVEAGSNEIDFELSLR